MSNINLETQQSRIVNQVLNVVKTWELRGEDKDSNADCPFEPQEYKYILCIVAHGETLSRLEKAHHLSMCL